jgi:tRNA-binding protein
VAGCLGNGADILLGGPERSRGPHKKQHFKKIMEINWSDFEKVEMRVGTIVAAHDFPEARKPAYKLTIDFGPVGILKSSAQITSLYGKDELVGRQVVAVVNFPKKQIGNFMSECLVLGAVEGKRVTLLEPGMAVENGARIG